MISWHNAPRYEYEGFVYRPDVDEYDDGIRKAWHNVYKAGREYMMHALPEFVIDETPMACVLPLCPLRPRIMTSTLPIDCAQRNG